MCDFKIENCEYNNADGFVSVKEVLDYLKTHDISFDTINCINSCSVCKYNDEENQYPFEFYKIYYVDNKFFDDLDEAVNDYDNNDIYEIQIYICENCGTWSIEYDNI